MLNAFYTRIFISLLLFGRQLLENTRGPFVWFCVSLFSIWYLGTHTQTHTQKPPTTTTVAHNSIPALNFDSKRFAYTAHRINLDYGIGQWSTNHWGIV